MEMIIRRTAGNKVLRHIRSTRVHVWDRIIINIFIWFLARYHTLFNNALHSFVYNFQEYGCFLVQRSKFEMGTQTKCTL